MPFGPGQLAPRLSAGLDGLGQAGLVVLGQQAILTDVVQIEADQVLLGLRGVLDGHSSSSLDGPGQILQQVPPVRGQRPPAARLRDPTVPDQPRTAEGERGRRAA